MCAATRSTASGRLRPPRATRARARSAATMRWLSRTFVRSTKKTPCANLSSSSVSRRHRQPGLSRCRPRPVIGDEAPCRTRSAGSTARPPRGRADEGSHPVRQVRRWLERPDRRKPPGDSVDVELPEAFGLGQVLEAMLAEVGERRGRSEASSPTSSCSRAETEVLSAVRRAAMRAARWTSMSDVVAVHEQRLPDVQSHPDPDALVALRPRMPRVSRRCASAAASIAASRGREGVEEGIALGVDLAAAVRREAGPQQPTVRAEQVGVAVADLLQQLGRALDVGEDERDDTLG